MSHYCYQEFLAEMCFFTLSEASFVRASALQLHLIDFKKVFRKSYITSRRTHVRLAHIYGIKQILIKLKRNWVKSGGRGKGGKVIRALYGNGKTIDNFFIEEK